MKLASSNILGIALADQSITFAELSIKSDRRSVRKTAVFPLTAEHSLAKPDLLGPALASFLRQNGFSASRGVVGVPAKWTIAVEKEVPPANAEQAHSMLRLAAERLPLSESGETVFDYAGQRENGKASKVLLLAMQKKQLTRVEQAMDAAGITVVAVTSTALALSAASNGDAPMLMLNRSGAEVVWPHDGSPKMLRHVSLATTNGHGDPAMTPLGLELRRTVSLTSSTNGTSELTMFDAIGLSDSQLAELSDRVGFKIRSASAAKMLGLQTEPGALSSKSEPQEFAGAMALAVVGSKRGRLPLDFVHSRLAPRPEPRFSRTTIYSAGAGVLVLIVLGWLYLSVLGIESDVAAADQQLSAMKDTVTTAKSTVDRIGYSEGYFQDRTPIMQALREVTQTFRDDEDIWAMTVVIQENREGQSSRGAIMGKDQLITKCQLKGKAMDDKTVAQLADRMRKDPKFTNVNQIDLSKGTGRNKDWTFTITFNFDSTKK